MVSSSSATVLRCVTLPPRESVRSLFSGKFDICPPQIDPVVECVCHSVRSVFILVKRHNATLCIHVLQWGVPNFRALLMVHGFLFDHFVYANCHGQIVSIDSPQYPHYLELRLLDPCCRSYLFLTTDWPSLLESVCRVRLFRVSGAFHLPAAREHFYNARSPYSTDGWKWSSTEPGLSGHLYSAYSWPCLDYSTLEAKTPSDVVDFSFVLRVSFQPSEQSRLGMYIDSGHGTSHIYLELNHSAPTGSAPLRKYCSIFYLRFQLMLFDFPRCLN